MSDDLFASSSRTGTDYDANSIEVLEGLEPVRRRPGMYIGGIDERALHHLAAEVIDNSMDEAVAGHATRIEVVLEAVEGTAGRLTVSDNGRGIPVDEHPKYPGKSALEVILTTLHSGGKFSDKAYATSGGLHGVGVSVVNALSIDTVVEVARNRILYRQSFSKGLPTSKLVEVGADARTGAARPRPSRPIPRFSATRRASSRRGSTGSRGPRPICSPASRSAGSAIPLWSPKRCPPRRCSSFRAGSPIT